LRFEKCFLANIKGCGSASMCLNWKETPWFVGGEKPFLACFVFESF